MKEKLLAQITNAIEGKNLSNIKGKTLENYVDAISIEITEDSEIDESFLSKHTAILTSLNGMYNADRAEDKRRYDSSIEEFKKNYKPTGQQQTEQTQTTATTADADARYAELQAKVEAMLAKDAEREEMLRRQNLLTSIKAKSRDKRFSTFVDNANVDYTIDANENFTVLNAAFEEVTKAEVDGGTVNVPNGKKVQSLDDTFKQYIPNN